MISNEMLLLIIVMALSLIMPVGIILFFDLRGMGKAQILYFESEKHGRFIKRKITDGLVSIGKKKFFVSKEKVPMVQSGVLVRPMRPLYILRFDQALPFIWDNKGLSQKTSSENLTKLVENKVLAQLLTPMTKSKGEMMFFIIGAVVGGLVGYIIAISI